MNDIQVILSDAIEKADYKPIPEIMNYVWKGPKVITADGTIEQEQHKLIDCSKEQLTGFLNHCYEMLYNKDNKNPGRMKVKTEVYQQIFKCNAELFIREQISNGTTRFNLFAIIRAYLEENNINLNDIKGYTLKDIIKNELYEFKDIPVEIVMDACLDKCGLFNRQHITTTFILKQGLWLTNNEYKEHETQIKGVAKKDVEEYFKKILNVNKKHNLKIISSGLSLEDMREALTIKDVKYSLMGNEKLRILRDRLLFVLLRDIDNHIEQWQNLMLKIQAVMEYKFGSDESVSNQ
jgi:hypothetical protein